MTDIRDEFEYRRLKALVADLPEKSLRKLEAIMREGQTNNRDAYPVDEFSARLGIKPATVRGWLRQGRLRGAKIGRAWLIPHSELERIINPPGPEAKGD